jgi:hypothetical protein
MGKLGQVDEIADFVVFLLSRRSGVVTGSVIDWDQNVFGGWTERRLDHAPRTARAGQDRRVPRRHPGQPALVDSLVVADIIPGLTDKVADRLGAEPAASPDALLEAGLDGVVIAAGTDAHPELILAAVDAGLPVFCEKPLARTIAEGAEVVARVKASASPCRSATSDASTSPTRPRTTPSPPASWDGCTPSAPPPSTRRPRRPSTSPSPGASSATAESTTSTSSAG